MSFVKLRTSLDHHYDGLTGDWAEYAEVAQKFVRARLYAIIPPEDAEDLVQRIILVMAEVGCKLNRGPGGWLWMTAHYELLHYWRERSQWPLLSLNQKYDDDPRGRELWETLAAPGSDLDAQMDAGNWLENCGPRILGIAQKMMMGYLLSQAERAYLYWWRKRMGIPTPKSGHSPSREGHRMSSSKAHEVNLTPYRVTVYKAICVVLERSPTPLHEKEISRLVAVAYPPLAEHIKGFHRQVHTTLWKRQRNGVCERVAPATWRFNGGNSQSAAPRRALLSALRTPLGAEGRPTCRPKAQAERGHRSP